MLSTPYWPIDLFSGLALCRCTKERCWQSCAWKSAGRSRGKQGKRKAKWPANGRRRSWMMIDDEPMMPDGNRPGFHTCLPSPVRAVGVCLKTLKSLFDSATSIHFFLNWSHQIHQSIKDFYIFVLNQSDSPPINSTINSTISIETAMIQWGPPGHRSTPKASPHEERGRTKGDNSVSEWLRNWPNLVIPQPSAKAQLDPLKFFSDFLLQGFLGSRLTGLAPDIPNDGITTCICVRQETVPASEL